MSLSEIVKRFDGGGNWDRIQSAAEYEPLPPGEYTALLTKGELAENSRTSTPSYKLTFRVEAGDYANRQFFADLWLTEKSMPYTKRDLLKLGITSPQQLEQPLPCRFRCKVRLALRKNDGVEFNRVVRFEVTDVIKEEPDTFAPKEGAGS